MAQFDPNADVDWDEDRPDAEWKPFARKWEENFKRLKRETDPIVAQMRSLEAASKTELEQAQEAAANAAAQVQAANTRAVKAEIRVQATDRFVTPDVPFAYIDAARFVLADGEVDTAAITAALDELLTSQPLLAKPTGPRAPAPNPAQGSSASGAPDLEAQIAQAQASGDVALQIRLQNQKLLAPLKQ
jgi:hypothetical protein